jgi:hypothetical protein
VSLSPAHDHARGGVVVLVLDVAHHHLDEVLDRDEAVRAAVFVDHQRHVGAGRLHAHEQVDRPAWSAGTNRTGRRILAEARLEERSTRRGSAASARRRVRLARRGGRGIGARWR